MCVISLQTSYEFVQRWNAIPRSARSGDYAELLKLIPLHQLPSSQSLTCFLKLLFTFMLLVFTSLFVFVSVCAVITNKLDGTMLTRILEAINEHFIPRGIYSIDKY